MVIGQAKIERRDCELAVMDFRFMGGSMGSAVGEKFARACDRAADESLPLVCVSASGGARMQEGILSLMQLPKTVSAVETLREACCPFLVVMTHPTTAGVLASFASLGDVILAEPGALLSFTGPAGRPADRAREASRGLRSDGVQLPASAISIAIVSRPELRPVLGRAARALRRCRLTSSGPRVRSSWSSCGSGSVWRG